MPNSRRGLLAAGLAATVVGSMGVVWTLNASAAETPEAAAVPAVEASEVPVAEASTAAAADPLVPTRSDVGPDGLVYTPPKLLPWGERPRRLTRGKPGASGRAIAAAGADAAPPSASGSTTPETEFAPKGGITKVGPVQKTEAVPPTPPSLSAKAEKAAVNTYFHYAAGSQRVTADGTWANLNIVKPKLADGDYHSLAELSVQDTNQKNTVEVGWTVDPKVNTIDGKPSYEPHLFVYYWSNGVGQGYNSDMFVRWSKNIQPGFVLPVAENTVEAGPRFGIARNGKAWWIAYEQEWVGYFPDSAWGAEAKPPGTPFAKAQVVNWFGEVASSKPYTCTQMGNGAAASKGSSARIGSITLTNGPPLDLRLRLQQKPTIEDDYYTVERAPNEDGTPSDNTFRYGGPVIPLVDDPDNPGKQKPALDC